MRRLLPLSLVCALSVLLVPAQALARHHPRVHQAGHRAHRAGLGAIQAATINDVNRYRAAAGLGTLGPSSALTRASSSWASYLVARGVLEHDSRLVSQRTDIGEVLGYEMGRAPSAAAIVSAWMQSSEHRSILLDPRMRHIGVGVGRGSYRGTAIAIWVARVSRH